MEEWEGVFRLSAPSRGMYSSQDLRSVGDVASNLPATMTLLPDERSLLTRGTKSLSDETMTKVSMGDEYSRSMASMTRRMSLEFLPDLLEWY